MYKPILKKDFSTRQYYDQSNLVYLSAFLSYVFLIPFFYVTVSFEMSMVYLICMISTGVSLYLNKKKSYGYASLVFILAMNFSIIVSVLAYGRTAGFYYYYFNLSGLIVFSNWTGRKKLVGILLEIGSFMILHAVSFRFQPIYDQSFQFLMFLHTINIIANVVGVANSANYYLNIAKEYQQDILQMAMTDFLTGLPNRNAFVKYYDNVQDDCSFGLGILMMDIDHFKTINDTYGHIGGDYVLKEIASILLNHIKPEDALARYGGEEFVHVFKTEQEESVLNRAEEIRQTIESQVFSFENRTFKITLSIGAVYRKASKDACANGVLAQADKLLYESKDQGRNRVTFKSL
ncbi:MAG: GGDEF domain-containing protein [Paracholeplasma sp.]|nr:GGDEF domain-containing protein [Paracholeplasma sp.]MDY3196099.1 GGDEF domain-containing protein [Paracholeplasma sp.]